MDALYTLKGLRTAYNGRTVLDIAEMTLCRGEVYALVGPNGAGKSTLLELLALIRPPDAGLVEFMGEGVRWSPSSLPSLRRKVTLVHQKPYLMDRSIYENLAFGLRVRGIHGGEQQEMIAHALESVGLPGFERRNARALSGGETQRVAIARALALETEVLLLDEPTSCLCREATALFEDLIERLRDQGKSIVLSSHDPKQPHRMKAQIIQLRNGRPHVVPPFAAHICRPLPFKPAEASAAVAGATQR